MRSNIVRLIILLSFSSTTGFVFSQDSTNTPATSQVSLKTLEKTYSRIGNINAALTVKSKRTLRKIQREEEKLKKKLFKLDSLAANNIFSDVSSKYNALIENINKKQLVIGKKRLGNYIPYLDTLKTSLNFLNISNSGTSDYRKRVSGAISEVSELESRLENAASIQQLLRERRQYLKEQLEKYGMGKYLKKLNKEVFYYSQLLKDYKQTLSDPKKIEKKAIETITRIPAFKQFIEKNSELASVFNVPGNNSLNNSPVSLNGVQTRASVQQLIQSSAGVNTQQFIQQQVQSANTKLEAISQKLAFVDLSGNPEPLPDFKPNTQKNKPFFKRLEYEANLQFGKTNRFLPTTGDVAASLGYKLNDNGVIGFGASYKMGLGKGIQHIRISNQGYGVRSYINWKIKGNFHISGGYERNYLSQLEDLLPQFKTQPWQQSGLIGATKMLSSKGKKKSYIQLLFDFLSYQNIPKSQPFIIRTGIKF